MTGHIQYTFLSAHPDIPRDAFLVNHYKSEEFLSAPYRYEIELRTTRKDINIEKLMENNCQFKIVCDGEEKRINGFLTDVQLLGKLDDFVSYKVVMAPRIAGLSQFYVNEVYLNKTVTEIAEMIFSEAGLTLEDYEFRLNRKYSAWAYRCQYAETHLDFLSRLFSREGIYYYFEQTDTHEKMIIVDHYIFHERIKQSQIEFSPYTGLGDTHYQHSIKSLVCSYKKMPRVVVLRDYNDDKPSVDIKGEAIVDAKAMGEVNIFGLNIASLEEGAELAKVRAEELLSHKTVFHGESTTTRLLLGYLFELREHFHSENNRDYLITSLTSEGHDPSYLRNFARADTNYSCAFTALAADVQYRPPTICQEHRIHGTLDAMIDAEGDGTYAEIDDEGRYKVILPFDRQQRSEGKASHWVRMSQAFAGENEGMHFPLRKGAHVLLSFIGGDPDRPVITGAMPNAGQPSVVNASNQKKSKIQTKAGNLLEIDDEANSNRIKLFSPHENTYFHLGASNHPGDGLVFLTDGIERKEIKGGSQLTHLVRLINAADVSVYSSGRNDAATSSNITGGLDLINEQQVFQFSRLGSDGASAGDMTATDELSGAYHLNRRVGPTYSYVSGTQYEYINNWVTYRFGAGTHEVHAEYASATNKGVTTGDSFAIPAAITGGMSYAPATAQKEKVWSDKMSYQAGNNYAWGDTCDYEFGNGYAESHVKTDDDGVPVNALNKTDWAHDKAGAPRSGTGTSLVYSKNTIDGSNMTLDMGETLVEKTIGNSYGYTNGKTLEVTVGDSESHTIGSSWEYVTGNSYSYLKSGSATLMSESTTSDASHVAMNMTSNVVVNDNSNFNAGFNNVNNFNGFLKENAFVNGNMNTNTFVEGILSDIQFVAGINNGMSFNAALKLDFTQVLGIDIEFNMVAGIKVELDFFAAKVAQDDSGKIEFKAPAFNFTGMGGLDLDQKALKIGQAGLSLVTCGLYVMT